MDTRGTKWNVADDFEQFNLIAPLALLMGALLNFGFAILLYIIIDDYTKYDLFDIIGNTVFGVIGLIVFLFTVVPISFAGSKSAPGLIIFLGFCWYEEGVSLAPLGLFLFIICYFLMQCIFSYIYFIYHRAIFDLPKEEGKYDGIDTGYKIVDFIKGLY